MLNRLFASLLLLAVIAFTCVAQQEKIEPTKPGEIVARLVRDVADTESIVSNAWVVEWLKQVGKLPQIEPTTSNVNGKEVVIDESLFYFARYGSPLAYARALDLAVTAGFEGAPGSRVFDFGYGSIGHLRMLAFSGLHAVGVDVAPLLKHMYRDASGPLGEGSVQVLDGSFPKDPELVAKVGGDFDLVISKNVLKRGYIHPTRAVADPRAVIDLGVDDGEFLSRIFKMLKPDGLFVIYNFCPAKASIDKLYIPWAEGESPFSKADFVAAGFEVLHLDVVDNAEARRLAHALNWDGPGGMKLETDLFAWYTIVRKKANTESDHP
ncbi:MAG: hypothetical protein NTU79_01750 [Planctomycetota bacterium]|nr:hypothetical protein [Planctomycetota bacterium]